MVYAKIAARKMADWCKAGRDLFSSSMQDVWRIPVSDELESIEKPPRLALHSQDQERKGASTDA
jgi:hypothetical protein